MRIAGPTDPAINLSMCEGQAVAPTPEGTSTQRQAAAGTEKIRPFRGMKAMKIKCSMRPKIVRILGKAALLSIVTFLHSQLAISGEFPRSKAGPVLMKSPGGWVCNAYGLSGAWRTVTGSPKPTRAAAAASVLKECQSSHFACRNSGCWLR
jgi:hypothetical protein